MPSHTSTTGHLSIISEGSETAPPSETAEETCRAAQGQKQRPCLLHVLIVNPPREHLGLTLVRQDRALRIASCISDPTSPFYGSPLCVGDVVVRINGVPTTQFQTTAAAMAALQRRHSRCGTTQPTLEVTAVDYNGDRSLRSTTIVWHPPSTAATCCPCITLEPERDVWNVTAVPRRIRTVTKIRPGSTCVRVGVVGQHGTSTKEGPTDTLSTYPLTARPTTFVTQLSPKDYRKALYETVGVCCEHWGYCCCVCWMDI